MAIDAVLMGAVKSNSSNTITSDSATTTNGTSKFLIGVTWDAGVTITGGVPSDSKGNTWVAVGAERTVNGGKQRWFITTTKLGGSSHTITVAFSGTAYPTISPFEITDAGAVDVATDSEDTGGMPMTMASGAFASQPQVMLMLASNYTGSDGAYTVNATTPAGTLMTSQSDMTNYWAHGTAKYAITSTSSFSPSMSRTNSGGGSSNVHLVSIQEAVSSGVTGTFASTLGGVTAAFSGTVTNQGSFASTLAGTTSAFSGSVTNRGTFASTLAGITAALSGSVFVGGSFASTLGGTTAVFSGTVTNNGSFSSTLEGLTAAFNGSVGGAVAGTFSSDLQGVSGAFEGNVINPGSFASTLAGVSANFAGTVLNNGSFASTLAGITASFSGQITVVGSFGSTLGGVTADFSGAVTAADVAGTFASTLGGVTASFSGQVDAPGGVDRLRPQTGAGR